MPLRVVDAILSGTHEPDSSHFDLLRAFADDAALERAQQELERRGYRTHEFGDSVLIESNRRESSRGEGPRDLAGPAVRFVVLEEDRQPACAGQPGRRRSARASAASLLAQGERIPGTQHGCPDGCRRFEHAVPRVSGLAECRHLHRRGVIRVAGGHTPGDLSRRQ
jgi:hypothetical protein